MFGLTRREQRWKAEQQAAEVLAGLAAVAIRGVTDARIAEARVDADELTRLRSENATLRDQRDVLLEALKRIRVRVDLQREPHWAYRNTVTSNREAIRDECDAAIQAAGGGK